MCIQIHCIIIANLVFCLVSVDSITDGDRQALVREFELYTDKVFKRNSQEIFLFSRWQIFRLLALIRE